MKTLNSIKKLINKNRILLRKQYHIKTIGVFGSYARGTPHPGSDIDILVEFSRVPDFFKFIQLERKLKELLRNKVDLVTVKALKPFIKDTVLKEVVFL